MSSSMDYDIYRDDLAHTQDAAQRGILLSDVDRKLAIIRGYQINWVSYHQGQMITTEDYEFVSQFDRQSNETKNTTFEKDENRCVMTLLSLLSHVAKEHPIQYILVMMDDILNSDKRRVKVFHDVAKKNNFNLWPTFISLLNRDDPVIMNMASRLLAKLACWSRVRCPDSDLIYLLNWLKVQLGTPSNEYLQSAAECIQWLMRIDDYRMPFVKADGINSIVSVLIGNPGFQLQYQLIFSLWMMSFQTAVAEKINENNVIPVLSDILRESQKEKVTRIIIAVFRNLLEKPEDPKAACVAMIQSKLMPIFTVLESKDWGDEDISADLEFVMEKLNASVQDLSTWDEYVAEVKSGRLEWSPVHRQEKFWRENAIKITDNQYELLKMLTKILESAHDPIIQAVACHDLGEFIRHYPRGKPAFDQLGCKEMIMLRMTHEDPQVKYEALVSVQKLLVHNWEFLGKQMKVE